MSKMAYSVTHLVRRWWLVALLTVLGALAGVVYAMVRPPVYAATAYVVVVAEESGDSTAVNYAQAYARIAGEGDTVSAAVARSNGKISANELRRSVRASSSPDAPVIDVTGSASRAGRAADLANVVAKGLISTANRHSTDTRMRLVLLSAAVPPADPASPQPMLDIAVGAAAGLLLGGLALLSGSGRTAPGRSGNQTAGRKRPDPANGATVPESLRWTGTAPVIRTTPAEPDRHQDRPDGSDTGRTVLYGGGPERREGSRKQKQRRTSRANTVRRRRPH